MAKANITGTVEQVLYGSDHSTRGNANDVSAARISLSQVSEEGKKVEITLFYDQDGKTQAILTFDIISLGKTRTKNLFDDLQPENVKVGALKVETANALNKAWDLKNLDLAFGVKETQRTGDQQGSAHPIKIGGGVILI